MSDAASTQAPTGRLRVAVHAVDSLRRTALSKVVAEAGHIVVGAQDGATIFKFEKWQSAVASRKNDDGTTSFITIDPTVEWFDFVVGERDGKRTLVIRDAQHEYVFTE